MSQRYPYFTLPDGTRGHEAMSRVLEVVNCGLPGEFVKVISPDRKMVIRRLSRDEMDEPEWTEEERRLGLDKL